ncbi:MAG: ATP-binding protein [bacterium]|nr:ATP-binding protein [bacterium]
MPAERDIAATAAPPADLYALLLSVGYIAVMCAGIALIVYLILSSPYKYEKRPIRPFLEHALLSAFTLAMYIGMSVAPPDLAIFFTRLRFIGLALLPVLWLRFCLVYGNTPLGKRATLSLPLFIVPAITIGLGVLSPLETLLDSPSFITFGLIQIPNLHIGGWFYIHALYSASLLVIALAGFTLLTVRGARAQRGQAGSFAGATAFTALLAAPSLFDLFPVVNLTPLGILGGMLIYFLAIRRYSLLHVTPIAYETIINHIDASVLVLDSENYIVALNTPAERHLGIQRAQVIGRPAREATPMLMAWRDQFGQVTDVRTEVEADIHDTNGTRRRAFLDVTITPLYLRGQRLIGRSIVWRDITERKKAEAERERLIVDLEAYSHMVAHDLKNPLNAVMGLNQLVQLDLPDAAPHVRQWLELQLESCNHMFTIIEDLLLLAEVRDQTHPSMQWIDMNESLKWVIKGLDMQIQRSGAQITIAPDLPPAMGLPSWIEQVWTNYLSNAIKYGGGANGAPPVIHIQARVMGDDNYYEVKDSGPGIPPEAQSRLFQQFVRLDAGRSQGTGLGLSITRRIVERLGGSVGVTSAQGQGSTFFFTLPRIPLLRHSAPVEEASS